MRLLRHVHAGRWLSAYVDGEAPSTRAGAVERHLAECPECRGVVEFILASKAVLQGAAGGSRSPEAVGLGPSDG
ncbi:MAG: anti-sigma factor family protein [Acidimicrobiales bacterium]